MNSPNSQVNQFFDSLEKWGPELEALRIIVLDCGLTEQLKWGLPVYTSQNKNVVVLHAFKESCTLGFFKGALLADANRILEKPGKNTQGPMVVRFTALRQIYETEDTLKTYIKEAIEVERAGLKVEMKDTLDYPIPEEFQGKLDKIPALAAAFEALTPGRQRGYLLYFSAPKQSKTREARIEKCIPQILEGKGMND